mgnify:CR=1 FL=1
MLNKLDSKIKFLSFPIFFAKIDEGIAFAKKVVALGDEKELSSRGYLALGIGYSLKAGEGIVSFMVSKIIGYSKCEMGEGNCIVVHRLQCEAGIVIYIGLQNSVVCGWIMYCPAYRLQS